MSPSTLFDKVWKAHEVLPETADTPAVLYIDLHLIHEVTSPQAFSVLKALRLPVRRPDRTLATMDHSTPTVSDQVFGKVPIRVDAAAKQVRQLEQNAAEFGVELFGMSRRAARHRARHQPGARRQPARHDHRVRRQPHEHARSFRRPRLRHRQHRGRPRVRDPVPAAAQTENLRRQCRGQAAGRGHRQGPDSRDHRQDRRVRRNRACVRVSRLDHSGALHGRAHDDLQYVDRGRRTRRNDCAGRDHVCIPRGQAARARRLPTGRPASRAGKDSRAIRARRSTPRWTSMRHRSSR